MDDAPGIVEFIRARLDEDEAVAVAASFGPDGAPWTDTVPGMVHIDAHWIREKPWCRNSLRAYVASSDTDVYRRHIARYDPARALREVAAKRATLELHKPDGNPADEWYGSNVSCTECGGFHLVAGYGARGFSRHWPCKTLRLLAAMWNDHPDYEPEWVPSS